MRVTKLVERKSLVSSAPKKHNTQTQNKKQILFCALFVATVQLGRKQKRIKI